MNSFTYNGVNSLDMGLRIESKNVFSAPAYDTRFQAIPGRDGDLILPNGRFPNVQITYTVFLPTKSQSELSEKMTAVKAWLYTEPDRYHRLTDTYDTQTFRRAVINTQLDVEDQLRKIGVFTVSFSCLPFKFLFSGQQKVSVSASPYTLANPTVFAAKPFIKVLGSGAGTLRITSSRHNDKWEFAGIDGYVEIDSEEMNFYKGSVSCNEAVEGSGFPILRPGNNGISFTGGISGLTIVPRWVTL